MSCGLPALTNPMGWRALAFGKSISDPVDARVVGNVCIAAVLVICSLVALSHKPAALRTETAR